MAGKANPNYFYTFVRAIRQRKSIDSKSVRRLIDREDKAKQLLELDGAFADKYNGFIDAYNRAAEASGLSQEELIKSGKTFNVATNDGLGPNKKTFQFKTGAKANAQSLNFKQNAQVLKKLIPDLAESHEIGHKNISVLKANIALTLDATKDSDVFSPEERQKLVALYAVIVKIDKIEKITGTQKEAKADLIRQLGDIAQSEYDAKASYTKDVNILKGVEGELILELEKEELNQFKGRLSSWVGTMFAGIVTQDLKAFEKDLGNVNLSNMKGSPSLSEDVEKTIVELLDPKKKTTKKKSHTSTTDKAKKVKTKSSKRRSLKTPQTRNKPTRNSPARSPLYLIAEFNKRLPQQIQKNMQSPALNYRTGRFANSVNVTNVTQTPQGYLSFGYTYQKGPYQTFEPGYAQGSVDRDPRRLIDKSMREIAVELAIGRFYTRRE